MTASSHVPSGWHRADIIAAVRKRGSTLSEMGRNIGLAPKSMHWALGKRHPRANVAISKFIGVPLHELWPSFYPAPLAEATPENALLSRKKAS
ncbi:hypothetical protein CCR94_16515 [Rhodoblastus sphagnicola]|uniref:Ner winged helix-turn-helix DNA-binding domain-containing protein n=1 Tax=Rhodoblastus sphagnicola TaxID=333368 RepID=A0A2S6N2Z5_9HYPH|nr:helix-turn-helix domain-containing protein [Rhodoblastus sphagnicola]MBB4199102.1 Ner family transcriptional regulator [Rhodoblastus sphagnicola]PPQ28993.1 hypothetical protein CCR94_16515 [Rhodoblastus sphagnicola]